MKPSPLEFARDFEKLKSELSRLPAADLRLLLLVRFWERLAPMAGESAYESYLNDYCSLVIGLVQADALSDLTIDSLNQVRRVLNDLVDVSGIDAASTSLLIAALGASLRVATLLFYVGAYDEALSLCAELGGVNDLALPADSELRGLSPLDTLRTIYDKYRRDYPELGTLLQGILAQWEEAALAVEHNRVWCLFVDKDGKGNAATGRMRLLRGTVEQVAAKKESSLLPDLIGLPRGRQTPSSAPVEKVGTRGHVPDTGMPRRVGACLPPTGDRRTQGPPLRETRDDASGTPLRDTDDSIVRHSSQTPRRVVGGKNDLQNSRRVGAGLPPSGDMVAFDNQVKTPDDPFIGVAYDSLKAARTGLRSAGFAKRAQGSYRAYLSIDGSNRTFTGDSIGLAVSLVAFTQLLKPEVMRQERFIASDIAVTGSITADGRITPVNNDTIAAKIERAFFSHVRYAVLPEANLATARDTVKRLNKQYPRRRLRLVSAAHLDDVLNDRNIIRSEKVCLGAFITKKAARYSRATKVQVPLLLLLLYALICIIYPKAWVGFDWNPQYVRLTERGFEALNKDSVPVWDVEFECEAITSASLWDVGDLDKDSANEVAFLPMAVSSELCESNAELFVYNYRGKLLYQRDCDIPGEYATGDVMACGVKHITRIELRDGPILLTEVYRENPARLYLKFWSAYGDLLGWYINPGFAGAEGGCLSTDGDSTLYFLGYNNRMKCTCFFTIKPCGSFGVGPPYKDRGYDLEGLTHGNQPHYVLFPRTDLNVEVHEKYNYPKEIVRQHDGSFRLDVLEVRSKEKCDWAGVAYYLDTNLRAVSASCDDRFRPLRDSLVDAGKLPQIIWSDYQENLLNAVIYWTDSGWVTEGDLRTAEAETSEYEQSN